MSRPSLIKSSVGSGAGPVVSARDDCRRDAGVGVVERCGAEERLRIVAPPAVSVEAAPLLPRRWVGDVSAENLEENDADSAASGDGAERDEEPGVPPAPGAEEVLVASPPEAQLPVAPWLLLC